MRSENARWSTSAALQQPGVPEAAAHADAAKRATVHWDASLTDPITAQSVHAKLRQGQHSAHLFSHGVPLAQSLRPRFVSQTDHEAMSTAAELVASAVHRLAEQALHKGEISDLVRRTLRIDPVEAELIRIAYVPGDVSHYGRLDGFGEGQDITFLEYNADSASLLITQELLARIYSRTPVMADVAACHRLEPALVIGRTADILLSAWQERAQPGGAPYLAIVDWPEGSYAWEFPPLCDELAVRGVPAFACTPDDLSYRNGRLVARLADGPPRPVTVVLRRPPVTEFLLRLGPQVLRHPLFRAAADGAVALVNPPLSDVAQHKSLFACLGEPLVQDWLPPHEAAAVRRHVPWTQLVEDTLVRNLTGPDSLLDYARAHQGELVLKPANSYAGRDVYCGWNTSAAAWDDALHAALTTPHILQARIAAPARTYPVLENGRSTDIIRNEATDPMLLNGKAVGYVSRTATGCLVSLAAGGQLVPVYTAA